MTSIFLIYLPPFVAVFAMAVLARRVRQPKLDVLTEFLASRWMPIVAGIITALLVWFTWGSLHQGGASHDERAYLLQARIFALGKWAATSPPIPEFFEQFHVLVTPALAAKYPPGHSLLLTPGVFLGLPGLMPIVLSAIAGGLVFALARQVTDPWVALLAWLFWVTSGENLRWRASYYSEVTTSVTVLLAWWSLLHWRLTSRPSFLLLLAAATGWGAITRPLTMLAFALPIGVIVFIDVARKRAWRDLLAPALVAVAILALLPIWSRGTTGHVSPSPLGVYTKDYMPWDKVGFGLDSTPPVRALPPDLQRVADEFITRHRDYTIQSLPGDLTARSLSVMRGTWNGWRLGLIPFVLLGIIVMPAAIAFATGSALLLVLAYGVYAHPPEWTLYYMEALPVLAVLTALGIWYAIGFTFRHSGSAKASLAIGHAELAVLGLVALSFTRVPNDVRTAKTVVSNTTIEQRLFSEAVGKLPGEKKLVFVRYAPKFVGHFSLVQNEPDLDSAVSWIVYDRGDENELLMRIAPERRVYVFDQRQRSFTEISRVTP